MSIHVNNFNAEQCLFFSVKNKGQYNINRIERKVSFQIVIFFIKSTLHFISWWVWRRMSEQSQNNRSSGWRCRWREPLVFLVSSFHNSVKKGMREQLPGMIARFIVLFWLGSPSYPLVSQMREWKKRSCFIFWVSGGFDSQASMNWCWLNVFFMNIWHTSEEASGERETWRSCFRFWETSLVGGSTGSGDTYVVVN